MSQSFPSGIPCAALVDAVIANTGQVFSDASSIINGNVEVATTLVQNNGVIHGTVTQHSPAHLPVIQPPAGATNLGTFLLGSGQSRTLAAGNYVASSFTINGNATLTVTGQVNIWVTGALILGGIENLGGVPSNLQFLVTGSQDVNVNGGGSATVPALIYAPNARVNIYSHIFGTVVGSTVTVNSGGGVIDYDPGSQCGPVVLPQGACSPSNSLTVLVNGKNATAYIPLGDWGVTNVKGVRVVPLEGTAPHFTILTNSEVNSCAANDVTGQVVCTANNTEVYLISGQTLTRTLNSAASAVQNFSGGSPSNAGVIVDPARNQAIISMGLNGGRVAGFQFLNLASGTFLPSQPIALGAQTSEDIVVDPVRNLILSPNENNDFVLVNAAKGTVFHNSPAGLVGADLAPEMDSAAEDCSTGLAISTVENSPGQLVFADLTRASFPSGTTTWSAPIAVQTIPEFGGFSAGTDGIAVTPGSHLGVVAGEFGGAGVGVFQLPSTSGTLALTDWVVLNVPNDPSGQPWEAARDPHTLTAFKSPNTGKSFAALTNANRTYVAVVDLQAALSGARNGHVSTAVATSFISYIPF